MTELEMQAVVRDVPWPQQAKPEYPQEPEPSEPQRWPGPATPSVPYPGHYPAPGWQPDREPMQPGPREIPREDPPGPREIPREDPPPEEPPRRDPPLPHQPGEPPPIIDVPPGPDANPIDPRVF